MIEQRQDKLVNLLHARVIDKFEYDSYLLFEVSELGRAYLKNALEMVILEEPINPNVGSVMKIDGRRSVWREIKIAINKINQLLQGEKYERPQFPELEWYGKQG